MNKSVLKIISSLVLCSFIVYTTPVFAFTKEETVYSKQNTNGDIYKTIVSTHLKNEDKEDVLKDISSLINIENTNGDESFTKNGNELTWSANGSDIYYQGETLKELPIKCTIKYELNGKEISSEDLAGKSGKVKITINYENLDEHRVLINGREVSMYTPFTVVTGTIFDNTLNKNIEVSTGKVVNDGTKTFALGITMPGMQESLNISKNKIDIPNSVVITMDTEKYEQKNIITFVTPKILEEKISFDEINNLYNKIDEIQQASKKIEDGADTLKDGMTTFNSGINSLNDKYNEFDNGINTAYNGSKNLNNGTSKINEGVIGLKNGTTELNNGVTQINKALENVDLSNMATLTQGILDTDAGVGQLKEGAEGLYSGSIALNTSVAGYVDGAEGLAQGVLQLNSSLALLDGLIENTTDETTKAQLQATRNGIALAVGGASQLMEVDSETGVTKGGKLKAGSSNLKTNLANLNNGLTTLKEGTEALYDATEQIEGLGTSMASLKTNLSKIQTGTETLNSKMSELQVGVNQVDEGSKALKDGLDLLNANSKNVKSGINDLAVGSNKLDEGCIQLSEGIKEFNTNAIDKIVGYFNADVRDTLSRLEKLQELSQQYVNYAEANENTAKEVKFIIITDSIKIKDNKEDENN